MRLKHISITNMAAFESFETDLPAVALVQGANGVGKTAFLNCLRYSFGRDVEGKLIGHDEDMIHGDRLWGEILIEFDDGGALRCKASRETNETVRSYRKPGARKFEVGRREIDAIANAVSYDALSFMNLAEKDQLTTLLKIMPVSATSEEMDAALGAAQKAAIVITDGMNGFDAINEWYKAFYEKRRELNVAADTHAKHAAELEKALPPTAPEGQDWESEALRLQRVIDEIVATENDQVNEIRTLLDAEKEEAQRECTRRMEAARTEANKAVSALKAQNGPELERYKRDLATAQERFRASASAEGTRRAAEAAQEQALKKRSASEQLSAALNRLNQLRETLAKRLPIKDLVIDNGRICRMEGGKLVPFSRWNTASQMTFCLRVAVLSHGEAGFVLCDNAEHFSQSNREALIVTAQKYAEHEGLQVVVATVSEQPLAVTEA